MVLLLFPLRYSFITLLAAYAIFRGKNSTKGWICWSYYTHSQQAHSAGQQQQHNTVTFAGLNLIVDGNFATISLDSYLMDPLCDGHYSRHAITSCQILPKFLCLFTLSLLYGLH